MEKSLGMFTFAHIQDVQPIDDCRKFTVSKKPGPFDPGPTYSDYGIVVTTDHNPHRQKGSDGTGGLGLGRHGGFRQLEGGKQTKEFKLVCRSEQHRNEWLALFGDMVGMDPGRRKGFSWTAAMIE